MSLELKGFGQLFKTPGLEVLTLSMYKVTFGEKLPSHGEFMCAFITSQSATISARVDPNKDAASYIYP